jgi:hypothetical protein
LRDEGFKSVAICLMHSNVFPGIKPTHYSSIEHSANHRERPWTKSCRNCRRAGVRLRVNLLGLEPEHQNLEPSNIFMCRRILVSPYQEICWWIHCWLL